MPFSTTTRAVVLVAAVGLVATLQAPTAPSAPSLGPRLQLLERQPLRLAGTGFLAREKVRVVVSGGDATGSRTTTASARGSFSVTFPAAAYDRCAALVVRANGARGSRALLKVPQPLCPPALQAP